MTPEQAALINKAKDSLEAARLARAENFLQLAKHLMDKPPHQTESQS